MIDQESREVWFREYFWAAVEQTQGTVPLPKLEKWARSMSMIADQHEDDDGSELVEA